MSSGPITRRLPPPLPAAAEHPRCPRCNSQDTKFCYYNNYNLAQPRHFCKSCRRYWTLGGSLRNVPIGGTSRRNGASSLSYVPRRRRSDQRHSSATSSSSVSSTSSSVVADHTPQPISTVPAPATYDPDVLRTFGPLLTEPLPVGFLALRDGYYGRAGGFRIGCGGVEEIGFGLGKTAWPFLGDMVEEGNAGTRLGGGDLNDLWAVRNGGGDNVDAPGMGGGGEGGCFGWPDLAISAATTTTATTTTATATTAGAGATTTTTATTTTATTTQGK